ncbi:MAG TPA: phosphoenolpyruvate carboxylase, partial [Longimicrobium sp.]|nr:phosphoenolpyruvate carboxylase [Longimicrobium sp.]
MSARIPVPPLWRAVSQPERLAELTGDDAALKEAPLRRDVRSLGILLGRVLREQEGEELYAAVEELRRLLIRSRGEGGDEGAASAPDSSPEAAGDAGTARAARIVAGLNVEQAYGLTKAFSIYFELTNLAETAHRGRRRRAAGLHPDQPPQPGT